MSGILLFWWTGVWTLGLLLQNNQIEALPDFMCVFVSVCVCGCVVPSLPLDSSPWQSPHTLQLCETHRRDYRDSCCCYRFPSENMNTPASRGSKTPICKPSQPEKLFIVLNRNYKEVFYQNFIKFSKNKYLSRAYTDRN